VSVLPLLQVVAKRKAKVIIKNMTTFNIKKKAKYIQISNTRTLIKIGKEEKDQKHKSKTRS
jgi:hypothetical protein